MCTESDKGQPARWKEGPSDINSFLNLCSFVCGESVSNKELKVTKGKQLAGRKVPQTSTLFVLSRSFPPCCSLLARPNSKWLFLQKILAIHRFLGDCVSSHFVSNSMRINAILPLPIETCFLSQLIHKDGPQTTLFAN